MPADLNEERDSVGKIQKSGRYSFIENNETVAFRGNDMMTPNQSLKKKVEDTAKREQ